MDLNRLYRAIPENRELRLSRRSDGVFLEVVDYTRGGDPARVREMIDGVQLLRLAANIDEYFLDRLRKLNAKLDRERATNG